MSTLLNFSSPRRLPVVLQTEAAECGLACLAMIAKYHQKHVELTELRQQHPTSIKGMTLARLIQVAGSVGLVGRPVKVELDDIKQLELPCIVHWNLNHYVVLKGFQGKRASIHDPATGERKVDFKELNESFSGIALELSPGPNFQRKSTRPPLSLRALAGSVRGLGRALGEVFALALILELLSLLMPKFVELVVDQVLSDRDYSLLSLLGIGFSLVLVAQTTVTALRAWVVLWISSHFNIAWSGNVFQHLLRLPMDYFLKRHLGDIVSRFGAVATIQQTITTKAVETVIDGGMAMMTFGMLLIYSPLLSLLTISTVVIYAICRVIYFSVYRESNLSQIVSQAKQQGLLMESMRAVQTIRANNLVHQRTAQFLNQTAEALNASIYVQRLGIAFQVVNSLVGGGQRIAVIWLGSYLALKGNITAGMLMAYMAYADLFTTKAIGLVDYSVQFKLLRLQGERLADIVMAPPEANAMGSHAGLSPLPSITLNNVSFRYSIDDPWVLRDCSLEVSEGEFVALVGPSGCGKSTLAKLVLGLLDPSEGSIAIGGVDLRQLGKETAREMIASVLQDDQLFSGTIAENISLFDEDACHQRIEAAARAAALHEDIERMPMGYFSLIGDMGSSLSGGQQQRLLLARALYRSPKILVLDEATSQVDILKEKEIAKCLNDMSITRVVIAHRPETIRIADRVVELKDCSLHKIANAVAV